ncbi:hypothetical protein HYW55_02615 [Candidatus Gottesmanbacteria bacterium]|nr:hypothetical protein [Candidatus Gottesmanbacteria bacterium]
MEKRFKHYPDSISPAYVVIAVLIVFAAIAAYFVGEFSNDQQLLVNEGIRV